MRMGRIILLLLSLFVVVLMVSSSPAEREIENEKVGDQTIREKGRMLYSHFRQRAKTLLTLKDAEWKEADLSLDQMEENKKLIERYQYIAKEAEYEIKQYIVDAISGNEPVVDPDIPPQSEQIASLFLEALFATTYAEQTRKEDSMAQILKDILEN